LSAEGSGVSRSRSVGAPQKLGSDALPHGNEVLQNGVLALKGKRDALFGEFGDLGIGVPGSGPALDIGGLGPTSRPLRGDW
jgi:hypothetical protein